MKVYCLACQKRCKGEVLRVQEQYMHRDCFKCAECHAGLERGGFFVRDARFYCPDDYQRLFGVKCRVCASYVVGEVITALGSTFHPSCFRCQSCRTPFTPGDRVTLWSNELYLCKACSHRERLKDEADAAATAAAASDNGVTAAASAVLRGVDGNTDTGYTTESTGHGLRSLQQQQQQQHYPPQHYHHYHYLTDGGNVRGGGHQSPGSFSCPSEASSSRRSRFGSQLARSYLTLEQEAERKLHPNDRYHRPASPCTTVARSPSPQTPLQHFHLPMHRDGSRPRSRAQSLASSSRIGGGTHPGSIGPRRPASVAGGGLGRPRTPRTPSPAPSLDPSEDPLLLSHYPAGSRPDLAKPAPIERDDWPCPPLPALLLAERQRQRRRDAESAGGDSVADSQREAPKTSGGFREGSRAKRELDSGRLQLGGLGSALLLGPDDPVSPPPSCASRLQRMQQHFQQTPRPAPQVTASRRPPVPSPQAFITLGGRSYSPAAAAAEHRAKAASLPPPERRHRDPTPSDAAAAAASAARRQQRYAELLAASSDDEDLLSYPNVLGLHPTGLSRLHRTAPPPPRQFPYEALRRISGANRLPRGADPARLESHLSDEDFVRVFRMERRHFDRLPEWRKSDLKRKADLF